MSDPLAEPVYKVGTDVSTWPYSKLARAADHLSRVQSEVQLWAAEQPFGTKGGLSDDRLSWTLRAIVRDTPPVQRWGTTIGDCIHNLRSALDSAVWEMATRDGRNPGRPHMIQFPIVDKPQRWADAVATRLEGVPKPVIERIRITQPFMRTESERPRDPLVLLQHLSNTDKHRTSISCAFSASQFNADFGVDFGDAETADRNVPPDLTFHDFAMEDGALLVEYRAKDPIRATYGGFGVNLELLIDTPTGSQKAFEVLGSLIQYVGQVLAVMHGGAIQENLTPEGVA